MSKFHVPIQLPYYINNHHLNEPTHTNCKSPNPFAAPDNQQTHKTEQQKPNQKAIATYQQHNKHQTNNKTNQNLLFFRLLRSSPPRSLPFFLSDLRSLPFSLPFLRSLSRSLSLVDDRSLPFSLLPFLRSLL